MKRKLVAFVLSAAMLVTGMVGCGSDEKPVEGDTGSTREITKVVLNEVAHSIFYAPMYAAIENGYFKEESIDLELVTGFGADKTMTAVLSGEADIGFMGPETTVYACNEGATDLVVNFAQLTQRAGNFLVARAADDAFSWDKLKGKDVLGGRDGGIPSHDVTWEYIRGIYEWTSRKAPDLKGFKYEERVIENLGSYALRTADDFRRFSICSNHHRGSCLPPALALPVIPLWACRLKILCVVGCFQAASSIILS